MEKQSPAQSKYWVTAVIIFFFGWVFIYAGRAVFSPLTQEIKSDFNLTQATIGGIMSLFYLTYTFLQVPSGIIGDKIGRKNVLVVGFVAYAVFVGLVSTSTTYTTFIIFWMLAGAAQGTFYGPQYALSSEAIPKKWLAVGSAIIGSGMSFGIALGMNLSSVMVGSYQTSWQAPFLAISIPMLIFAAIMFFFIKEKAPGVETHSQSANGKSSTNFKALFANRNLVMAYIAIFCSIYGFFVIITWLPTYLELQRGMSKQWATNVASIVPWLSIVGTIFFSFVSDKLGKRKPIALLMMPLSLLALFGIVASGTNTTLLICVLVLYGFIGKISLNPILLALCADNVPKGSLSTAFGLYNFFGMCASIVAPYMTGFIADSTGNLNMGFYVAAAITLIGIIALFFVNENKSTHK